jgi:hypothetical protein
MDETCFGKLSAAIPVVRFAPAVSGERAFLFCKCGGALTPAVELLGGNLIELTGILCQRCGTLTPIRAGLMDAREARTGC